MQDIQYLYHNLVHASLLPFSGKKGRHNRLYVYYTFVLLITHTPYIYEDLIRVIAYLLYAYRADSVTLIMVHLCKQTVTELQ